LQELSATCKPFFVLNWDEFKVYIAVL